MSIVVWYTQLIVFIMEKITIVHKVLFFLTFINNYDVQKCTCIAIQIVTGTCHNLVEFQPHSPLYFCNDSRTILKNVFQLDANHTFCIFSLDGHPVPVGVARGKTENRNSSFKYIYLLLQPLAR